MQKESNMNTLREKYKTEVIPAMQEHFKFENVNQIPKLQKVVVNTSIAEGAQDAKIFTKVAKEIAEITCQAPVITKAKKAISNFKLRAGMPIGCKVTLRGEMMYEFVNRLFNIALPRVRDFKGVSPKGFDGKGNYTLGLTEQIIFPEINPDKIERTYGMNITFVTSAKNNDEGCQLLKLMGMPFRKQ